MRVGEELQLLAGFVVSDLLVVTAVNLAVNHPLG